MSLSSSSLLRLVRRRPCATATVVRLASTSTSSLPSLTKPQPWDVFAGVVLERRPIITQDKTGIETEYASLLAKYEVELSKRNAHEVRKEKEKVILDKIKTGDLDPEKAPPITAQDEEDKWTLEFNQFKPGSRKTDADKSNDQRSLERALDLHLLLLIEQQLGKNHVWVCPQGKWQEGETLRQTAERILSEVCPQVKVRVLGNAPWGFYKYKYPKKAVEGQDLTTVGAKVFFYKAEVVSGQMKMGTEQPIEKSKESSPGIQYKNYAWLTRGEISGKLVPEYYKHLYDCLIEES